MEQDLLLELMLVVVPLLALLRLAPLHR